ncbi:ABC transporter substrate-binding protein [Mongoliimonas terrestris]|uniref:ABC transporter substrate-binding protein n=1 Tax=Mongoliimonas terrestris TaxID=1709001 RepID=UPI000949718E|nr:ABC transporter substrate-binding protein [Mongoliimonas terrestris]
MNRREFLASAAAVTTATALPLPWSVAFAQSRSETLLFVSENGPNNLDIHGVGTNRPGYEASWNCYDRLMSYGVKTLPDGSLSYDKDTLVPEMATEWTVAADAITFKLRQDAVFHDGTPVTAHDVKWSFDRAVTVGGFPTFQMKAGSLMEPGQFEVVDDFTFKVKILRPDSLLMPDLAVIVPAIFNSKLVKANATEADPWGLEYTKNTPAGSGAFKVEKWTPGTEVVYVRNEDWKCGPLPQLKKVIWRTIPSAGNRRALIERGDVDLSFDLPAKDVLEMAKAGKVKVASTPISNGMWSVELNVTQPPFDNKLVRQAIAYALPYGKIMDAVMYGRAKPLYGAASNVADSMEWPRPTAYTTDVEKAKALLAEAGYADGFETVISFDLGQALISEPTAVLVQESLAAIGIRSTINKVPGANWRGEIAKKTMPFMINFFSGWLDYPEYFFFWCYHGQNAVFNTMSYQNPDLDAIIDAARAAAAAGDTATYETKIKEMITLGYEEVPRIPLFQPSLEVAMQPTIDGYTYWFHRQLDYRGLKKA